MLKIRERETLRSIQPGHLLQRRSLPQPLAHRRGQQRQRFERRREAAPGGGARRGEATAAADFGRSHVGIGRDLTGWGWDGTVNFMALHWQEDGEIP